MTNTTTPSGCILRLTISSRRLSEAARNRYGLEPHTFIFYEAIPTPSAGAKLPVGLKTPGIDLLHVLAVSPVGSDDYRTITDKYHYPFVADALVEIPQVVGLPTLWLLKHSPFWKEVIITTEQ